MGPGGVVWEKNRVQRSRETVPLRGSTGTLLIKNATAATFILQHIYVVGICAILSKTIYS